jgi:hypothetical protein
MEAAQNDGRLARRPLKNSSREIQAHEILLSRISQLLEEYNVSMKVNMLIFPSLIDWSCRFNFTVKSQEQVLKFSNG